MQFVVKKKIDLSFLGEGWESAFITFTPFTFKDNDAIVSLRTKSTAENMTQEEIKKASDDLIDLLKSKFVEGQGFNGEKLVPITKDNLADLPMELITTCLVTLQGQSGIPPKG